MDEVGYDDGHQRIEVGRGSRNRAKSRVQPSRVDAVHPLFKVASDIVSHVHDYPTLICLAMTCRTFHAVIHHSRTTLAVAFENLERQRIPRRLNGQPLEPIDWVNLSAEERSHPRICTLARLRQLGYHGFRLRVDWSVQLQHQLRQRRSALRPVVDPVVEGEICNYDIFRHNVGQLLTLDWLPCYGCRRIKSTTADFFNDQVTCDYELFGDMALQRRCIECSIDAPASAHGSPRFQKPLLYLQDMPKGYPGFRLRCSTCRSVQWIMRRPGRRQQDKRLCDGCYVGLRAEAGIPPGQIFWEEWNRLAAFQATIPIKRKGSSDIWASSKTDVWGEKEPEMLCQIRNRFDILRVDDDSAV